MLPEGIARKFYYSREILGGLEEHEPSFSAADLPDDDFAGSEADPFDRTHLCRALYALPRSDGRDPAHVVSPGLLAESVAAICGGGYNFISIRQENIFGGMFVEWGARGAARRGVAFVWAVDVEAPERPLKIRIVADGVAVFNGTTAPAHGPSVLDTGWRLVAGVTIRLEVEGRGAAAALPLSARAWEGAEDRAALTAIVKRTEGLCAGGAVISRENTTPQIMARLDGVQEAGPVPRNRVPGFVRYLAGRFEAAGKVGTPLAAVSWVIGELLENPEQRRLFRLSTQMQALFAEPAFSRRVMTHDASLALFAFWRRHYNQIDIFSEVGLRRIQYNFATAPYIAEGNNALLVTAAMREQLSRPAPGIKGGEIAWSWYWVLQHEDRGQDARLREAGYARLTSLRELMADIVRPERLSFNPASWHGAWSLVERRSTSAFSRFDVAMLAQVTQEAPALALAALGPERCRALLMAEVYERLPQLLGLSALPDARVPRLVERAVIPAMCDLAIIGHHNQTGLGRNMGMFAQALEGMSPLLFNADNGVCLNGEPVAELRARVVILCVNADRAPEVMARFARLCEGAHVIGFFLWETDRPPEGHLLGSQVVDEIWCPTEYVARAYGKITSTPVVNIRKGLTLPPDIAAVSERLHGDGEAFTFLCLAEFGSGIIRKNPLDVVLAFERAFPDLEDDGVRLLVKLREITPGHWSNQDGYWEELEERMTLDPRIRLVVGDVSDDEYWALLHGSNVFVTLHRSEGFGYGAADAMLFERGVIATDYSGTMDFCDEETAYPVGYTLIPTPPQQLGAQGYVGNWARPDIDHAAARMREARADREGLEARGRRGAERVRTLYDFAVWREDVTARVRAHLVGGNNDEVRVERVRP